MEEKEKKVKVSPQTFTEYLEMDEDIKLMNEFYTPLQDYLTFDFSEAPDRDTIHWREDEDARR